MKTWEYDMIDDQQCANAQTIRRAKIESLLKKYPNVNTDEQAALIRWFKREATALDVALLSGIDELKPAYKAFRSDHIDRVSVSGFLLLLGVLLLVLGGLGWLYW